MTFFGWPRASCCTVNAATSGAWKIFTSFGSTFSIFTPSASCVGAGAGVVVVKKVVVVVAGVRVVVERVVVGSGVVVVDGVVDVVLVLAVK